MYVGDNALKDLAVYSDEKTKLIQDICWHTVMGHNCLFQSQGLPKGSTKIQKFDYKFETKRKNGGFMVLLNTLSVPVTWPMKNGDHVEGNALEAVQPYVIVQ